MKIDPKNPKDENRDRFVLSKGHCSPALYATLALKGFFSIDELKNFNTNDNDGEVNPAKVYFGNNNQK